MNDTGTILPVNLLPFLQFFHLTFQVQSDPEGTLWRDPPHYWEQIVYPAYVRAHKHLFEGGDVENGLLNDRVPGILLFDGSQPGLALTLEKVMERVVETSKER
jgi:nicotinamide/nicotinate riboside kinase